MTNADPLRYVREAHAEASDEWRANAKAAANRDTFDGSAKRLDRRTAGVVTMERANEIEAAAKCAAYSRALAVALVEPTTNAEAEAEGIADALRGLSTGRSNADGSPCAAYDRGRNEGDALAALVAACKRLERDESNGPPRRMGPAFVAVQHALTALGRARGRG